MNEATKEKNLHRHVGPTQKVRFLKLKSLNLANRSVDLRLLLKEWTRIRLQVGSKTVKISILALTKTL